ncbi:MAG: glycosyltransferase family 4 protein [Deltaproteobacteria bacterium]|nr:glycosyltransferase family 4 protein [Deltaproteobacteria bacterium]
MRIALINPIIQTIDRPKSFFGLFSRRPKKQLQTDTQINFVKLATAMAELGHEVTLFISDCFRPKESHVPGGMGNGSLKICYLPTRIQALFSPAYAPLLPSLYKELKKGNFDVIQSSELTQPCTWIASLTGKPVFVWEELDQYFSRRLPRMVQKLWHKTMEEGLKKKVSVIPRSQAAADFLKKRGWEHIHSPLPTPVDTEVFKPLEDAVEKHLLTVTRLAPDRGLSFLLELMEKLVAVRPQLKLVVVGSGSEEDKFRAEILKRNLSQNIELISLSLSHRELNHVYNESTMTLITTLGGLFPYTASESMACGKPVISRFGRALKDLIHEGETGYLADTVETMKDRILHLLENPAQRKKMGEEARHLALKMDFKNIAERFIRHYQRAKD